MYLHLSVSHSVHRGCVSQHTLRQTPRWDIPACIGADTPLCIPACIGADTLPPPPTATAEDGTHPAGVHTC